MSDITKAREVWVSTSKNADYVMGVQHEDAVRFVRGDIHERLEAKLTTCEKYRDAYAECDRIATQAVRDLEAKLAKCEAQLGKAVDALRAFNSFDDLPMPILLALAELTGGKDE